MKRSSLLIGTIMLTTLVYGQTKEANTLTLCNQQQLHNQAMTDPVFAALYNTAQAELTAHEEAMKSAGKVRGVVDKVPVVFQVLHMNGPENISREQILDQLAILNRDFRLQNADAANVHDDFKASNPAATCIPSDVEVEFVLATKAPDGTCFSGITRTYSDKTLAGDHGQRYQAAAYGNDVYQGEWPHNKYLNIIVAKDLGGAAGFTFTPGYNDTPGNSIYMRHDYTGSVGTSNVGASRALTHEAGHWLNLSHSWGDGDIGTCGDDHVNDTPQTRGSQSCNLDENACGPRANVENYMDYAYCSKMFSGGQVDRMRAAITSSVSSRSNLWTPANLTATGADGNLTLCVAGFTANKKVICSGGQITFADESYNLATGWTWTFTGGSPATSSAQNPTVTYNTPGTYAVKLVATDGTTSDTEEKTGYIIVLPQGSALPFYESFESLSTLEPKWIVNEGTDNTSWQLTTGTGSSGTKCAKLGNFNGTDNDIDELESVPVDLSGVNSTDKVTLSYRYAYRKRNAANDDILRVSLSGNCGDSWEVRKTMTATQLSTEIATTDWTPASTDFVTVHMTNVTSIFWLPKFRFKFQFTSGSGNNIYLDDINIYEGPPSGTVVVGLGELSAFSNAVVFPNPADEEVHVRFTAPSAQKVKLTVTDLMGKVLQEQIINASEGNNLVLMPTADLSSGMYLIRFNESSQTLSFMVK